MGFCVKRWRRTIGLFEDDEGVLPGVLLVVVGVLLVLLSLWGPVCCR